MPEQPSDLESRLRAHLARVAEMEARPGLEERIIARAEEPRHAGWRQTMAVVAVTVMVVTMLLMLTMGNQVSNVFSNISSGLNG